ncbi:MAG TPA: hypothetical protein VGQ53_18985 [Chitinophagaceae bacterium]|nr:hypothetical protein [Chitinophagaceae bacterium]
MKMSLDDRHTSCQSSLESITEGSVKIEYVVLDELIVKVPVFRSFDDVSEVFDEAFTHTSSDSFSLDQEIMVTLENISFGERLVPSL